MELSKIDKNFLTEDVKHSDAVFYSADDAPLSLHGVFKEGDGYVRMPRSVAQTVSENVLALSRASSGARVRFVTDSPYVIIKAELDDVSKAAHMSLTGTAGIDLYTDGGDGELCEKLFIPSFKDGGNEYFGSYDFPYEKERLVMLNLPLYSRTKSLYIGVKEGSTVKEAPKYTYDKPVVFYGSSVTQGACASRPGMSYPAILSRRIGFDFVNLGFSGSAKGEAEMAEYISRLDMSLFVMDYDYNATTEEDLERTHKPFFDKIRAAQPNLPIIIISKPRSPLSEMNKRRREIVRKTYLDAVKNGDRKVYFVDGESLFPKDVLSDAFVDMTHPSDLGFYLMAIGLEDTVKAALG